MIILWQNIFSLYKISLLTFILVRHTLKGPKRPPPQALSFGKRPTLFRVYIFVLYWCNNYRTHSLSILMFCTLWHICLVLAGTTLTNYQGARVYENLFISVVRPQNEVIGWQMSKKNAFRKSQIKSFNTLRLMKIIYIFLERL